MRAFRAKGRHLWLIAAISCACPARAGTTFTVSVSSTDPYASVGTPTNEERPLFFWLACSDTPISAFDGHLVSTLDAISFTAAEGVENFGNARDLLLAIPGCPSDTAMILGSWTVLDLGGTVSFTHSTSTGRLGTLGCGENPPFTAFPRIEGYSSSPVREPPIFAGGGCGANAARQGLVIGYGKLLRPPFEFSTTEDGSLWLNGMQYFPPPSLEVPAPIEAPPHVAAFTASSRSLKALAIQLSEGESHPPTRMAMIADTLDDSPLVESATLAPDSTAIMIEWKDWGTEILEWKFLSAFARDYERDPTGATPREPPPVTLNPLVNDARIDQFWHILSRDQVVIFGYDTFVIGGSTEDARELRKVMEKVESVGELSEADVTDTILEDASLRKALTHPFVKRPSSSK